MKQQIIIMILVLYLMPAGLMAQKDSTAAKESGMKSTKDSTAVKTPAPVSAPSSTIDSSDEYNFLELYYYGPDYGGLYDVYDPWDIYPDREGDSQERESTERDSQERDTRE